jgi:predicted secreted protein
MTEAVLGYGIELRVGATTAATDATVLLGGLTDIPAPSFTRETLDVTAHDSPNGFREFIGGLKDPGEMACALNWTPGNDTHDIIIAMMDEDVPRVFEVTFTQVDPAVTCTFTASLTTFEPTGPVEGQLTASLTLRVTGVPVWA